MTSLPGDATIVVTSADQSTTATYISCFLRCLQLVWNDEFDYSGAVIMKVVSPKLSPFNGGWANAEEQHYTNRLSNSFGR